MIKIKKRFDLRRAGLNPPYGDSQVPAPSMGLVIWLCSSLMAYSGSIGFL